MGFYKSLGNLALPMAAEAILSALFDLVNVLMVGHLGETALTAVGLGTQLFFIEHMLLYGFCGGISTILSQLWGNQDIGGIKKATGFATLCTLILGILFFFPMVLLPSKAIGLFTNIDAVVQYGISYVIFRSPCLIFLGISMPLMAALRSTQQTIPPFIISCITFTLNAILSYLFIFGKLGFPVMGVAGAALAASIARLTEVCCYLIFIFPMKNIVGGRMKEYIGWSNALRKRIFITAIPTTVNETMWSLGMSAYNAAYGRIGIAAFAAVQASDTVTHVFTKAIYSIGDATLILVGKELGKGNKEEAYELAKRLIRLGVKVGLIAGIFMILISWPVSGFFGFTAEGRRYTMLILLVYGAFLALKMNNALHVTGALRGGGDTRFAMACELGTIWFVGVPVVFLGALFFHLPVYFVALLAQLEEIVKWMILRKRFRSKKWLGNIVSDL